jgi:SAM-dependent methyltransferase
MNIDQKWAEAQTFEKRWWLGAKQYHRQEIEKGDIVGRMMLVDKGMEYKSVIDIGCGPFSLLQRVPVKEGTALDPIFYNEYEVLYQCRGIKRLLKCGEDLSPEDGQFDEAWIYNCLQHVKDPVKIIENAMRVSSVVRIFEWTHIDPYEGHLHKLMPDMLSFPFKNQGWSTLMDCQGFLNHSELNGNYYLGIFSKDHPHNFKV